MAIIMGRVTVPTSPASLMQVVALLLEKLFLQPDITGLLMCIVWFRSSGGPGRCSSPNKKSIQRLPFVEMPMEKGGPVQLGQGEGPVVIMGPTKKFLFPLQEETNLVVDTSS